MSWQNNFAAGQQAAQPGVVVQQQPLAAPSVHIKKVKDAVYTHGVKICVYGNAGQGKTFLSGTAPRPLIISAEKGLLSLYRDEYTRNLDVIEISDINGLDDVHKWALSSTEARNYDTFCFDSISEIAEVCLLQEKKNSKARNSRNGWEPYANLNERIMQVFRDFRDYAHKHVYFVAKQEWDKDQSGMMMHRPSMPGKELTVQLPYMFDEIFQLQKHRDNNTGQDVPWLLTRANHSTVAKDRSGRLDEYEPADLTHIFNKILAT